MYAKIIIEYPVKSLDKAFTYIVPTEFLKIIKVGSKVLVPFGKNNVNGIVLSIFNDEIFFDYELKSIILVVDPEFFLNTEMMRVGEFISYKTLCPLIACYQAMLPVGKKIKTSKSNFEIFNFYLSIKPDADIDLLKTVLKRSKRKIFFIDKMISEGRVLKTEVSSSIYKDFLNMDYFIEEKERVYRLGGSSKNFELPFLNDDQKKVVDSINYEKFFPYLLYGVTGSGKTLCYINMIKKILSMGKSAILLVPEIALTSQVVSLFYDVFSSDVAVIHSRLSSGEKYDEYEKIFSKKVSIVVGTRSAIFAPLDNLGIIIIDEEHSDTYKQSNSPRYHAKDIALYRAEFNNCPVVFGSATPSFDAMARAYKNVYCLLTLKKRAGSGMLPSISLVDMSKEYKRGNFVLSEELFEKISDRLLKKEQVLLLLNRRGFASYVNCSSCGHVYKCPNCDISLTYHKSSNNMRCHYCGYASFKTDLCVKCGEDALNFMGLGTEQLESLIKNFFPTARILRMDADTTSKKGAHAKMISAFSSFEYDILIGTQMIRQGLDFPLVTLAAVINADAALNLPSYNATESAFSLLTQVSGRSGRKSSGEVVIQSLNIDNFTLKCVSSNNYLKFFEEEMSIRSVLKYPPYMYLVSIKIISKIYELASIESRNVVNFLKQKLSSSNIILGPSTAHVFKFQNNFRFQIIIKYKDYSEVYKFLKILDDMYATNNKVYLEIDFNPSQI